MRSLGAILNLGERSSRRPLQRKGSLSTVFLEERYSEYESGVSTTDHAKADALRNMPFPEISPIMKHRREMDLARW